MTIDPAKALPFDNTPKPHDVRAKTNGALEFVVQQTDVKLGPQTLAEIQSTSALRHPETNA